MNACGEAQDWVKAEGHVTLGAAWKACPSGDWMLWFAGKMSGPPESEGRKKLVLAACGCARIALPYAKSPKALACIETAEAWANGNATIEDVRKARIAATGTCVASYAAYAALTAAYSASAAYAYAASAYASYAYSAASNLAFARCADIVRKHYPKPPR